MIVKLADLGIFSNFAAASPDLTAYCIISEKLKN